MMKTFRRPRPMHEAGIIEGRGAAFEVGWQDAKDIAEREMCKEGRDWCHHPALGHQRRMAQELEMEEEATSLGRNLSIWARAAEIQALAKCGIKHDDEIAKRFTGRAKPVVRRTRPVRAPRRWGVEKSDSGGTSLVATLWATCRAMVARMANSIQGGRMDEALMLKVKLVRAVIRNNGDIPRAWEAVQRPQDAAAALFAVMSACSAEANAKSMEVALGTLTRLEACQITRDTQKARDRWAKWVSEALKEGAGKAHRWCNAPNAQRYNAQIADTMIDSAKAHDSQWRRHWGAADEVGIAEATKAVKELRQRLKGRACDDSFEDGLQPTEVRRRATRFKRSTGIGGDCTEFTFVASASDAAIADLAGIMKHSVREVAFPLQTLTVLENLIAKKCGGSRATALCTSFYRLLMGAASGSLRSWDLRIALSDDTAVAGVGPQVQSMLRPLLAEAAATVGRQTVVLLWDVEHFFDSIRPSKMIEPAEKLNFPSTVLGMAMIMHRAPRIVMCEGCAAEPIGATAKSILAGCVSSTSLARGLLRGPVAASKGGEDQRAFQHVDDITQLVIADGVKEVILAATRNGETLGKEIGNLGLTISAKSEIVASDPVAAELVARNLRREGINMKIAVQADDVGVTTSAGKRRAVAAQNRRLDKADIRSTRVAQMVAVNKQASCLHKTGTALQAGYGATVQGASPSQILRHRRQAAKICPNTGPRPCTTALLHWSLGPEADPEVALPKKQVEHWIKTWRQLGSSCKTAMLKAWVKLLMETLLGEMDWGRIRGPAQATMATVAGLGWKPAAPDLWFNAEKTMRAEIGSQDQSALREIVDAVQVEAEAKAWRNAAHHYLGAGLDLGKPTLEPARKARRSLMKDGLHDYARALDCVVTGAAWPGGREGLQRKCECGKWETAWHKYWGCDRLKEMDCDEIKDSQYLLDILAEEGVKRLECLWGRAVLPWCFDAGMVVEDGDEHIEAHTTGFHLELNRKKHAYTDGSGGLRFAPEAIRKSGSGTAVLSLTALENDMGERQVKVDALEMAIEEVEGRQTSARAELTAALTVAKAAEAAANVTIHPDSRYVIGGVDAWGDKKRCKGANGALWERFYRTGEGKQLHISANKVKSHAGVRDLATGDIPVVDYMGNVVADALASTAAQRAQSRIAASQDVEQWHARVYLIAKRLACIEALGWQRQKMVHAVRPLEQWRPPVQQEVGVNLADAINISGHKLRWKKGRIFCVRCLKHRSPAEYDFWTSNRCAHKRSADQDLEGHDATRRRIGTAGMDMTMVNDASTEVTVAQRRRMVKQHKEEVKWRKAQISEATKRAWASLTAAISAEAYYSLSPLEDNPPYEIHRSHAVIECGGYLGCVRCATVCGYRTKTALTEECKRGSLPSSRGPIRKLARGQLPHVQCQGRHGDEWPTGEIHPVPRRWIWSVGSAAQRATPNTTAMKKGGTKPRPRISKTGARQLCNRPLH